MLLLTRSLNAIGGSKNLTHNEACMTHDFLSINDMTLIDHEQLATATENSWYCEKRPTDLKGGLWLILCVK